MKINYRNKTFLFLCLLFLLYAVIIVIIQFEKEKKYQIELQKSILKTQVELAENFLETSHDTLSLPSILVNNSRISIIDKNGKLLYDNVINTTNDHSNRPEINAAKKDGEGISIRQSTSNHTDYLYYAKEIGNQNFIRIALPYSIHWNEFVKIDNILLYIVVLLFFITIVIIILLFDKFSKVMNTLNDFATSVEQGKVDYENVHFSDTASGKIGKKIIAIYKQLENSKIKTLEATQRNQQLKQELSNNIAHELKTPVSSIRGYLEILLGDKYVAPDQQKYFLERSYAQTLRLSALIEDVSLINKMEEAADLFHREKVNIKKVCEEAIKSLQDKFDNQDIKIINALEEHLNIAGNSGLIYSIFRNLLENAIMHAGEHLTIGIQCTKCENDCYYFTFYDTGCGVEETYLTKIFERFLRIDEGRSRETGGTGLGLSIVKHAVMLHGGEIYAENRLGGGLEFHFTLRI